MLQDYLYVTGLAFRDIGHERVLSLCMVCSLGAIFTPIIILLGLQQGIIGNMLDTLESDPASRLVRPKFITQSPIPAEELEVIRQEGLVFIPSETSHLLLEIEGMVDSVNVVPSSLEDPFVKQSQPVVNPSDNWVVIPESLARKLVKEKGDLLTLSLKRTTNSTKPELVPFEVEVIGIVEHRLMPDLKVYLPQTIFDDIYHWRKGYSAPDIGLKGNKDHQFTPEYDGVLTGFGRTSPSAEEYRQMLASRLPFSTMPTQESRIDSHSLEQDWFLWRTINSTVTLQDIQVLENAHFNYGYAPELIPYVHSIQFKLKDDEINKEWEIFVLPKDLSPNWHEDTRPVFYVSLEDEQYVGVKEIVFRSGIMGTEITLPVILKSSNSVPVGHIVTSHHFSGLIRSAQRVGATYDKNLNAFVLDSVDQIRYFRIYSESIDGIDSLVEIVKNVGDALNIRALKEPVSRINEVERIRTLSDYMQRIYILIAAISGVSTIFAVFASVYATVQRRKRDLAYLNMLGVEKATIVFFPFVKSLILIASGIVLSFIAYWLFSYLASHWFIDLLGETESLTRLDGEYILYLIATIFCLGGISSLIAGSLVNGIDPKRYTNE